MPERVHYRSPWFRGSLALACLAVALAGCLTRKDALPDADGGMSPSGSAASPAAVAEAPPAVDPPDAPATSSEGLKQSAEVRELLVEPCGSCHRSSLATAKPAALRIFDLDEARWDRKLTDEQVSELCRRAGAGNALDPVRKATLEDYRKARLGRLDAAAD